MTRIDLRSDTFTQPTPGMLQAMFQAKTGDDVFGEDPTVNLLEQKMADLFGMEAALYCPTGTMSNQIGIKVHTQPGDEVICEKTSHVYLYEGGGIAYNSGCQVKLIEGDYGRLTAAQIVEAINPDDIHKPPTRLVSLENTANRGGGTCYALEDLKEIKNICVQNDLKLHLDGARLFNAIVAQNEKPATFGKIFDSISVCLNKGLGCPIGSVLLGNQAFIKKSRRIRKVMGGGMRQAGYMAAAGLYALEHHIERLHEDHLHAKLAAASISQKSFCKTLFPVATNILIFETYTAEDAIGFVQHLKENGIDVIAMTPTMVRLVFHLDITADMTTQLIQVIEAYQ